MYTILVCLGLSPSSPSSSSSPPRAGLVQLLGEDALGVEKVEALGHPVLQEDQVDWAVLLGPQGWGLVDEPEYMDFNRFR